MQEESSSSDILNAHWVSLAMEGQPLRGRTIWCGDQNPGASCSPLLQVPRKRSKSRWGRARKRQMRTEPPGDNLFEVLLKAREASVALVRTELVGGTTQRGQDSTRRDLCKPRRGRDGLTRAETRCCYFNDQHDRLTCLVSCAPKTTDGIEDRV